MSDIMLWVIFVGVAVVLALTCSVVHKHYPEQDDNAGAISFIICVAYWVIVFYTYKG